MGQVKQVKLHWWQPRCVDCDTDHPPTPDRAHAEFLLSPHHEHEVELAKVTLGWHLATCGKRGCGWKGNPTEHAADAQAQLEQHDQDAHTAFEVAV